MRFFAQIMPIY